MRLLQGAADISVLDRRASLLHKIENHTATVGVVGIGYVGLPLAVEKAKVGFRVIGFDRNTIRINQINQGLNYIRDVSDADLSAVVHSGKLSATSDFSPLEKCDAIIVCVPTPLTANLDPDISYIRAVGAEIAKHLR
ncbi:MAG: hypothetical protein M3Z14_07680, partial [Candidatus Eremiobacteraeota bacterium]|nr:hypothetical protein [Candidatus Eremiobacteraeota bacterium]